MKFLLFILLFGQALSGCNSNKEKDYFTGTINYTYTYSSDSLDADSISRLRPSASEYRYDLVNYRGRFIAQDTLTVYYSGEQNKCISETNSEKNYSCEDYSVSTDSLLSWKIYDTDEKVLGFECRVLELQKQNSLVKYHVSKEFRIAPSTYQRHRSYDWDVYGEKSGGGLILKLEHRFHFFTMKGVATSVKKVSEGFTALGINEKLFTELCKD